ncbi:MAG: transposase [Elusimicrobia bacterium]|nr:transposase [Elusimicrobiota bacterium]
MFPQPRRPHRKNSRRGGRPAASDRACFAALLWLIGTGRPLRSLPAKLGRRSTVARRIDVWGRDGRLERCWWLYLDGLTQRELASWKAAATPHARAGFWRRHLDALTRIMTRESVGANSS